MQPYRAHALFLDFVPRQQHVAPSSSSCFTDGGRKMEPPDRSFGEAKLSFGLPTPLFTDESVVRTLVLNLELIFLKLLPKKEPREPREPRDGDPTPRCLRRALTELSRRENHEGSISWRRSSKSSGDSFVRSNG